MLGHAGECFLFCAFIHFDAVNAERIVLNGLDDTNIVNGTIRQACRPIPAQKRRGLVPSSLATCVNSSVARESPISASISAAPCGTYAGSPRSCKMVIDGSNTCGA